MNSISVWQDVVFQRCECSQEDMEELFFFLIIFFSFGKAHQHSQELRVDEIQT